MSATAILHSPSLTKLSHMSFTGRGDSSKAQLVRRTAGRRLSAPSSTQPPSLRLCASLPYSLEALDLSSASPTQTLAHLRFFVLSYLADLERRLREFGTPEVWKHGEHTIEEAAQWARTALDMLEGIRADVCSHLPEVPFSDISMDCFLKSFPDLPDVPNFAEMRPHLPDIAEMRSHLPDMSEMRSHLPDMPSLSEMSSEMYSKFDDVRTRYHELDFRRPFSYIPILLDHLDTLHSHLSNLEVTGDAYISFAPNTVLSSILNSLLNSHTITDLLNSHSADVIYEGENMLERATREVAVAVKRSFQGMRLIKYSDLPHPWRNNQFVTHGYRFIPIERWPLILLSLVTPHNELLNIQTHLIPLLLWGINLVSLITTSHTFDLTEVLFMGFALLCLSSSVMWHTMSGCADHRSMEICARVDYVGIGWLISASIGSIVHYAFRCHTGVGKSLLGLCLATGLAGNLFPFMTWFNKHEYRSYRIVFFLVLTFSAIGPIIALSLLHSPQEMYEFIGPVFPSLMSYIIGLMFYATHFPERIVPAQFQRKLDVIGGNSHAIWHCFIVLGVSQHRKALDHMRNGLQCAAP